MLLGTTASAALLGAISLRYALWRESTRKRSFTLRKERTACPSVNLSFQGWHSPGTKWAQRIYSKPQHPSFLTWLRDQLCREIYREQTPSSHMDPSHPTTPSHVPLFISFIALHLKFFYLLICSIFPYQDSIRSTGMGEFAIFLSSISISGTLRHVQHLANVAERTNRAI